MTTQSEAKEWETQNILFFFLTLPERNGGWRREERDNLWNKKRWGFHGNLARCQQGRAGDRCPFQDGRLSVCPERLLAFQRGRILTLHPPSHPSSSLRVLEDPPQRPLLMKNREMFHKVSDLYPLLFSSIVF
ncbi:hypothetical protein CDAR_318631 [Caerostris darwini]|uniref:Uncharacterized protein n=1 Tax=Caerostris darwini TaxID=1538125 RepID=A0AAV4Q5U8_9ARAC|nr:hypothetical protein CDAR_318631 [Caerostris darwini]